MMRLYDKTNIFDISESIDVNNDKTMSLLQEYDTRTSMEMNFIRFSANTVSDNQV